MTKEEKLEKVTEGFSLLPDEKQEYILGILQALVFAHNSANNHSEIVHSDLGQNTDSK